MSTIKTLIITNMILKGRIEKLIEGGRKTNVTKRTQGFYESRLAELRKVWDEFSKNDFTINTLRIEDPKLEPEDYIVKDYYGETEGKYLEYVSELTDGLRKFLTPPSPASDNLSSQVSSGIVVQQQESQLPRITLPKFNGSYDMWRSFHDLFVSLVHNNARITPVQKLHYLKGCLVGDAEKLLRHTPITNQDYEPAWKKLQERYNNTRILVNHQLKTLVNQPKLHNESAKGIKALIDTTEECLQQLNNLNVNASTWDALLIYLLVQKLPITTLKLWEEELGDTQTLPTYTQFKTFLNTRLNVLESIADVLTTKPTLHKPAPREATQAYHTLRKSNCSACSGNHFLQRCPNYQAMNVTARRKLIESAGHCFNCLSKNHTANSCNSKFRCQKCKKKHHTTIHEGNRKEHTTATQLVSQPNIQSSNTMKEEQGKKTLTTASAHCAERPTTTQSFVSTEVKQALLATARVIAYDIYGNSHTLRCLVDPGSQSSFISKDACKRLHLNFLPTSVEVTGLNIHSNAMVHKKVKLRLHSYDTDVEPIEDDFLVLHRITDPLPSKPMTQREWTHIQNLDLADPTFWKPGRIDILLGAKLYTRILREGIRRGPNDAPIAINTIFGWILLGPTTGVASNQTPAFTITTADTDLNKQLKQFWELEEIPSKSFRTTEEEECEQHYEKTYQRLSNGRYQVQLPFVNNELPCLGESRPQALRRFLNLQQRLKDNPPLEEEYKKCLNEYIELNHQVT